MLQIRQLCKEYRTGSLVQKALDHVDLNLRDNEFVAILGPSGSGKTTLLNIIGGLDRYDSGELIINGISTKKYRDRDWDSYRNHTIGFVFQSYNLIPHQTVLANVELALTISGIGKSERRERAVAALTQVGLGDQLHKKPNQMSGGQMQRVAIARALVNDPDIVLADEPTGALDSSTSIQVMELLKEVARDRLVVMVTHNPELAREYATRIVNLRDGQIRSDSDPLVLTDKTQEDVEHRNMGKSSMSFLTALSLSFNNLRTKKARTLLTAFAGSIGIIGIALILALSTGVNAYIQTVEAETLSEYPLQIQSTGMDLSSMLTADQSDSGQDKGEVNVIQMVTDMFSTMDSNDLASLKEFLDSGDSGIEAYTNAVEYSYNAVPQIYRLDGEDGIRQVNPDRSFEALGLGSSSSSSSMMSSMMGTDVFYEMPENASLYEDQYDVKAGRWPENYNECVLVLTAGGSISDFMLYTLGLRDALELDEMVQQFINEENIETPGDMGSYSYDDILGITFKLVNSSDYYQYDSEYQVWTDKTDDDAYMRRLVENGEDLTIVGIVQPAQDANGALLNAGICYPASLVEHVAGYAADSEIVKSQLEDSTVNVFTGEKFGEESGGSDFDLESLFSIDEEALQDAFAFDPESLTDGISVSMDFSDLAGSGSSLDLSGMLDLSDIPMSIPQMPQLNLQDLMSSIQINVSREELENMVGGLLAGYQTYAEANPQADYSNLLQDLINYLKTDDAKSILGENVMTIIEENGTLNVTADDLRGLFQEVLTGFEAYAAANGYTDPERFDEYLLEYLSTAEVQDILTGWGNQIVQKSDVREITPEQLERLASGIASGYQSYAQANGLPDPSKMGDYFADYLGTETAAGLLSEGIASMVDTEAIQQQISGSIESFMEEMMTSYGSGLTQVLETQVTAAMQHIMSQLSGSIQDTMTQAMRQVGENIQQAISIDPEEFMNAFTMNMDAEELMELLMSMNSSQDASYEGNLQSLGYVDFDEPSEISIYPRNFESKEQVVRILDDYNSRMEAEGKDEQVITYTDMVGTLMSSVTDIIDIISYVLIAFVAISLVVSSIMIGVITYISVLERKKEIGILRAIGASKGNISQVFNAETFIIGLCAGLIGIGLTLLILIPGNMLIHQLAGTTDINAVLPVGAAVILILLSVFLTLLGGLIPSKKAAKSDPVTALRTE